ncbi:hypothetical protein [Rhizobium rhizogenes]|uniref:hypothetical protein n=1 Tax=Rhizobium rhizogenes TaxID=359 RepID=UPI00080F90B1|nr:hypothetical protein [Rhizobium rhizogenes]NTI41413.1 hypothetical protein [Rhizobium rhizogenes]OCJ25550.1 hypothetical protein A6U88_03620 [Agrobacterium sp. B131/95]
MGYDLHITRKLNWFDASPAIELHEWLEYVASDPDLQYDGFAETLVASRDVLRIESQGICIWKGYSGGENSEAKAWLTWSAGDVAAKNPDEEIRRKMWSIAQSLGARVQGDEGEHYGQDGGIIETTTNGVSSPVNARASVSKRPWWKFW